MKIKLFLFTFVFLMILSACKSNNIQSDISSEGVNSKVFVMQNELPVGGDARKEMCTKYKTIFYGADTFLAEIVGKEKFNEWLSKFENERDKWECNIYNAVRELNISKDDFIKANKGISYTSKQIDAIFSDDEDEINRAFVNDFALMVDDKIYTPDWLAVHTMSDYEKNGIDSGKLKEYLTKINTEELYREKLSIEANLLSKKISTNTNVSKNSYYEIDFYNIPDFAHQLVPDDEYEKWVGNFIVENNDNVRNMSEFNIVNFVREFKIKKSDFIKADKDKIYSKEQIDAIFSGSDSEINDAFISEERESSFDTSSETSPAETASTDAEASSESSNETSAAD